MDLTQQQLRRLIEKSFPHISNFYDHFNVEFELIENSKSFWSEIYIAHIQEASQFCLEFTVPKTIFVKIPKITQNVKRTEDCHEDINELQNVLHFYCEKEKMFSQHFSESAIPHFPIPRFYYAELIAGEATGGLVAENLKDEVYSVDHLPGYNDQQLLRLMRAIAGLHFHTQTIEDESIFEFYREKPGHEVFTPSMFQMMISFASQLETICPELFGNGRIQNLKSVFDYSLKNQNYEKSIAKFPKTLVHGDMNCTNIFWKKGDKSDELRAIIDFQIIYQGSIVDDIIRILTLGLSRQKRIKNTVRYLKHYHDTLSDLYNGNPPYSFEDVKLEYNSVFATASSFTIFGATLYYKMYKDGTLGKLEEKERNCQEVLSRLLGIIEDVEHLSMNQSILD